MRAVAAGAVLVVLTWGASLVWAEAYVLGPHDVVEIKVWEYETLDRTVTIGEDGTFFYPMLGRVNAGGLTVPALEAALKKRLADGYVTNPVVNVNVKEYASKNVVVFGEASTTGLLPIRRSISLIELIARVGVRSTACGEIIVVRSKTRATAAAQGDKAGQDPPTGESDKLKVTLDELLAGDLTKNVTLYDGDLVIFTTRKESRAGRAFVFGEVNKAGMVPVGDGLSLRDLLMACGGVTRSASGEIMLVRARERALEKTDPGKNEKVPPPAEGPKKTEEESPPAEPDSQPVKRRFEGETYEIKDVMLGIGREVVVRNGDTVYVPSGHEGTFYITGQVRSTGRFPLRKGTTVVEALAMAGGLTRIAHRKRVLILRIVDGKLREIKAEPETKVMPGDIIRVPEAWW